VMVVVHVAGTDHCPMCHRALFWWDKCLKHECHIDCCKGSDEHPEQGEYDAKPDLS